jgi:hypothetical protein
MGLELKRTHNFLLYADDVNLVDKFNIIKESGEVLLDVRKTLGLEANADKTNYMYLTCSLHYETERLDIGR